MKALNCPSQSLIQIGDGVCDMNLLNEDCLMDDGDCDFLVPPFCMTCMVERAFQKMGDHRCDEDLNTESCCFDAGDCDSMTQCPTCHSFLEVGSGCLLHDFAYHYKTFLPSP